MILGTVLARVRQFFETVEPDTATALQYVAVTEDHMGDRVAIDFSTRYKRYRGRF